MKLVMAGLTAAMVLGFTADVSAEKIRPPVNEKPKEGSAALEQKLLGDWKGGPCQGDWTFMPDGAFNLSAYSPGGIKADGTWKVRWDALPPTLMITFKTSDDDDMVGKTWELKLLELDDNAVSWQHPANEKPTKHVRRKR
ncbi:hypothetical protein [Zavarzinella formosa]|uniref:hypothetical protein n=1 Tax=Zavarzinella formosa TaxID=360055 RepID=UPI0003180F12|nr:hypothetical protein [Zavarzinella formosa]